MPSAADRQAEALADVERITRRFHETYERLAPSHDYETRRQSAVDWEHVPPSNAALMRAVVTELLHSDTIRVGTRPLVQRPMAGQTRIDDELRGRTHDAREALDDLNRRG